jgi:hypothetical protein
MSECDTHGCDGMVWYSSTGDSGDDDVLQRLDSHNSSHGESYSQAAPVAQGSVPAEASPWDWGCTGVSAGRGILCMSPREML